MGFETRDKQPATRIRTSGRFKLKLKYKKDIQVINIKDFGFIPETLLFHRVDSSWFTVSAILTPEEIKKEDKKIKEKTKVEKEVEDDVKKSMEKIKKIMKKK